MPRFLAARPNTELITLPWDIPLADWSEENLVALPRGLSRHVVRFVRVGSDIYAFKEVMEHLALHEYELLRDLARLDTPSVEAVGVVTARADRMGEPLDPILMTRHLQFSLPYRSLFNRGVRQDTVNRLVDAMVVLLARLHLIGFLWGDVSLSNTLFRRDAGAFAAYLVDAETSELHDTLTTGQREHDLTIARTNLYGEFCDLEAGGLLDEALDPLVLVETIDSRYRELWDELTGVEEFNTGEMHRIEGRVRRLNALGFDVAELDITTDFPGSTIRIQPKVVDAGHHSRRLIRLTGMDTEENQARRLLNDLDYYRARTDQQGADEAIVAHEWLTEQFEPIVQSVPMELRAKLEPAELYHEVLEHRWFLSEEAATEVSMEEAAEQYMITVLRGLPDEAVAVSAMESMGPLANPFDPSQGFADDDHEKPYDPWEDEAAESEEERRGRACRGVPGYRRAARKSQKVKPPAYQRGGMRRAPSRRMTSPLSSGFSMIEEMSIAYSSGRPSRGGCGTRASKVDFVSPGSPAIMGVSITPGAMVITRIALSARSLAALNVNPTMPPLLAAYAAWPIWPSNAATLAVMITIPRSPSSGSLSIMVAAASRSTLKVPTRLMSITV